MIALFIILAILLILFIITLIKIEVLASYTEKFSVRLKILFFQKELITEKKKKKKSKKKKKEKPKEKKEPKKEEKKKKKEKKNFFTSLKEKKGIPGLISFFMDIVNLSKSNIGKILKGLHFDKLILKINIVSEDVAQTALTYGKLSAAIYPSINILSRVFTFDDYDINMTPDFIGESTSIYLDTHCYIRVCTILGNALALGFKILVLFIKEKIKGFKNK